jgi:hypothetical protein
MSTDPYIIERDRSYGVRETITGGKEQGSGFATVNRDIVRGSGTILAGTVVTVRSFSNAGFRGIEATITAPDGTSLHNVSAGALTPCKAPARSAR